jgi:hypothetical protein
MHCTRGYFQPSAGGRRGIRHSLPTAQQGHSPCLPAIPLAVRVGTRFLPQVAAAATRKATDEEEVRVAESQSLLLPPAGVATRPSYLCDWAQAIECAFTSLAPLPCQREGCDVLVHHVCQGTWERREGYDNIMARYCCRHHPNYKYRSAPEKDNVETV